jgi:N-acetylneuraminic acid mutarotase
MQSSTRRALAVWLLGIFAPLLSVALYSLVLAQEGGKWRERAPMPTARSGIAAAVLGGKIFVFGGEAPSGTFDQTESYDPGSDAWKAWSPMPTARHGLGAATLGQSIYVISGGSHSSLNEVFTP